MDNIFPLVPTVQKLKPNHSGNVWIYICHLVADDNMLSYGLCSSDQPWSHSFVPIRKTRNHLAMRSHKLTFRPMTI